MDQQNPNLKWEGKVTTKLETAKADQIWGFYKDFFNLSKWFPSLSTSYGLYGSNGEPGCIRYCAGSSFTTTEPSWCKERLVDVDEEKRSLSYEILESNIGFNGYKSTVVISSIKKGGCVIEWFFTVDPVKGWKIEDLIKMYEVGLRNMALKMENDLIHPTS